MLSRLPATAVASLVLLVLCLLPGRTPADGTTILLLAGLTLASDMAALPVPRRGHLSNGFVWAFVLAQLTDTPTATTALLISVALRMAFLGKGRLQARALHATSELLPAFAALLVLQLLASEPSYGFPKGHLGSVAALFAYYALGRFCLGLLYPRPAGSQGKLLRGATESRELQLRICTMLAPAAALLAAGGLWRSLWLIPVMLGIHQFFWERLSELKDLEAEGAVVKEKLQDKDSELQAQQRQLSATKGSKDLVERCLENFSSSANLKDTARAGLRLAADIVTASSYVLFWESANGFGPLLALDGRLQDTELAQHSFPAKSLLSRCYKERQIFATPQNRNWCFPLHEGGVLYLGSVSGNPGEQQKQDLKLLARQLSFGLRSALLFEKLTDSLGEQERARRAAEEAKHQLEVTQGELIQSSKMAAIGQLAAGVAHELNSPLAAVLIAVQAGKRSLKKGNTEKALDRFVQCEEAVEKAKVIANGLLTRSRKSSDKTELVCLSTVSTETAEFLAERLAKSGTSCTIESEGDAQALVNSDEVSQILTNLILNSHQAMTDANCQRKSIRISITQGQGSSIVELSDTGPGIPPEHQERIFDPFFTTKTQGKGTGLGLYISAELAHKNGATLKLKKSSAQGACFQLSFPRGQTSKG